MSKVADSNQQWPMRKWPIVRTKLPLRQTTCSLFKSLLTAHFWRLPHFVHKLSSTFKLSPTLECWHHVVNRTVYTDKINVPSCILRNWICSILIIDTNTNRDLFTGSTVVTRIDQILLEPIVQSLKWTVLIQNKRSKLLKVNGHQWNCTWSVHESGRTKDRNEWSFDNILCWTWFVSRSLTHNWLIRSVHFRLTVYFEDRPR